MVSHLTATATAKLANNIKNPPAFRPRSPPECPSPGFLTTLCVSVMHRRVPLLAPESSDRLMYIYMYTKAPTNVPVLSLILPFSEHDCSPTKMA